jgi:hypothetical protein
VSNDRRRPQASPTAAPSHPHGISRQTNARGELQVTLWLLQPDTSHTHTPHSDRRTKSGHGRQAHGSRMDSASTAGLVAFCTLAFSLFWRRVGRSQRVAPDSKRFLLCYQMLPSNASRAQHTLYLRLFMLLCAMLIQETTPVLGKLFRPHWRLPNPFGSVITRHQTPDNWQAAIIRKLRQCWASLGWTCRHRHFRMTRIRKRRFSEARLREGQSDNSTTIDGPGLHLWLATSACQRKKKKKKKKTPNPNVDCHVLCMVPPPQLCSLWHFARATCLCVMKIAGSE